MSFDVYTDSECSHSSAYEDPDSRDSGVSMSADAASTTDFVFTHPCRGPLRKTSIQKNLLELDEEMEDLVLNELVAEFNEHESITDEKLKRISCRCADQSSSSSSKRVFGEITNSLSVLESPKSHFQNDLNRAKRQTQSKDVTRRFSRHLSCFENRSTAVRKRTLCEETTVATKRMNVASPSDQQMSNKGECSHPRKFVSFSRTMSSSVLERGEYAHIAIGQLPKMLHVEYSLETVPRPQVDSVAFKSIDGYVLAKLMWSMSVEEFSNKYMLIDCRYPYEYNGGHVRGAINLFDPSLVEQIFYPTSFEKFNEMRSRIPIFYCEFSQKRGPTMAAALRQFDRKRNEARYPDVDYKEIYLLDRGYKKFFEDGIYTQLCEPPAYVRMLSSPYKEDLKRYQMHRARSFSGFGTSVRMADMQRRGRLNFSVSVDGSGGSPRNPRRRDLFGSPFSPPNEKDETAITPSCSPTTNPIRMASFS